MGEELVGAVVAEHDDVGADRGGIQTGVRPPLGHRLGQTPRPAVIVRERGYYKVRAGTFATKQEAQAAAAKLKSGMGGSPFVVAEP